MPRKSITCPSCKEKTSSDRLKNKKTLLTAGNCPNCNDVIVTSDPNFVINT